MFEGQPKGLYALALANTGERFGYYTMLAIFVLFLQANFGFSAAMAGNIYGIFLALVYFLPVVGGIMADRFGFGKMVTVGIGVMFVGYMLMALPLGSSTVALIAMFGALVLISFGTGMFKGNLQVMVGNLYDAPEYADKRDAAFSIFYMAINIGAMFAPSAAVWMMDWAQQTIGVSEQDSYHYAFGVACASLIVSMAIYYGFRSTFKHTEGSGTLAKGTETQGATETAVKPEKNGVSDHDRITALCLVFVVVIFFWMAFHQNGLTLTFFARDYVSTSVSGPVGMEFDVWNLVLGIFIVYGLFGLFQSKTVRGKAISGAVIAASLAGLVYQYENLPESVAVSAPIFQQFNPCFVVALTPVSLAIFSWLGKTGKEPSAPRKIAYGMLVAGSAYVLMCIASLGLPTPEQITGPFAAAGDYRVSPNWLVSTYLVLTFGELLLSPMGISFVSKVAPVRYKGLMMGGWFAATAVGNYLTSVASWLWGLPVWIVWAVLIVLCLLAATFMFAIMKRLEKVC